MRPQNLTRGSFHSPDSVCEEFSRPNESRCLCIYLYLPACFVCLFACLFACLFVCLFIDSLFNLFVVFFVYISCPWAPCACALGFLATLGAAHLAPMDHMGTTGPMVLHDLFGSRSTVGCGCPDQDMRSS